MNTNRKHTHAFRYLTDAISSPENFSAATPDIVDHYLESKGVKLGELDIRMNRFLTALGGKIALTRAARERRAVSTADGRRQELSKLSDSDILAKLVAIYGSQDEIPLAARTKRALGRKELESLYLDATDES
jgi:hypothetical protein